MIRRLPQVALWLLGGHAVAFGVFWLLLQVPESSTPMLAVSLLLAIAIVLIAAAVNAGAAAAWDLERPFSRGLLAGARRFWSALAAAAVFLAAWMITGALFEWHAGMRGQMDAAAIAHTGSPNTAWVHATIHWVLQFARWTLGLSLAVTLLGWLVAPGDTTARPAGWRRAAFQPRRWLLITIWFVLLVALPWSQVYWRPAGLSLGLETWFVAAKLALIAVLMAVGWSLVLREGQPPHTVHSADL
jgi:hypothetical protein